MQVEVIVAFPNLIQFHFCSILKDPNVCHCHAIPLVRPAEDLAMEVSEDSALPLGTKTKHLSSFQSKLLYQPEVKSNKNDCMEACDEDG